MLGFTLPLFILVGAETLVGTLLLCPKPLNQPAIALARSTYTQVGATVFFTLAGVLALLLASPIYDAVRLYYSTKDQPEQAALDLSDYEARTLLSFTLTSTALGLLFFERKLGKVLGDLERQSVSEAALLKQVKGLQSEYTRMVDSNPAGVGAKVSAGAAAAQPAGPAAGAAAAGGLSEGEVAELRRLLADLEQQNSTLQARAFRAEKEHAEAESNLSALKTQARGLESEYDRLLAEHDELKRQAARAGVVAVGASAGGGGFSKKDE